MTKGTRPEYWAHTGPQAPSRGLTVPDVDFKEGFARTLERHALSNSRLDRIKNLLRENPGILSNN